MNRQYEMLTDETGKLFFLKTADVYGDQYYSGYIFDLPNIIPVTISYRRYREMQLLTDIYGYDNMIKLITDINRDLSYGQRWISLSE